MAALNIKSVLLLDGVDEVCGEKLAAAGISVTVKGKLTNEVLLQEIKSHDGVVVRSATKITAAVLSASPRLRLVGRAGTGVDNIDVEAATRAGVLVMNTPGGNTLSAAEHTCALICSLARFLPIACETLKSGAWDRKRFMGNELYGKTLAVVGLGKIGREVAKRMQSFHMTVIGYDPFVSAETAAEWDIEAMELEALWPRADYITLHTPLLPHTRNLVGEEVLMHKCKPGVKVINVARGGIVDEVALLRALENGRCGGAGLDVFLEEPPTDFKLVQHPKVVCTPHLGASTEEAQLRVAQELAEQIVTGTTGGLLTGLVNGEALVAAGSAAAQPWLALGTALGQLASAVMAGCSSVTIETYGSEVAPLGKALSCAVLAGLLKDSSKNSVNLVNAVVLAGEQGVSLKMSPTSSQRPALLPVGVQNSLTISVSAPKGAISLLGSIANCQPLLYAVDGSAWECGLPLSRTVLLYSSATGPVSVLPDIAAKVAGSGATLLSLAASGAGGDDRLWLAARVEEITGAPDLAVPGAQLMGKVTF